MRATRYREYFQTSLCDKIIADGISEACSSLLRWRISSEEKLMRPSGRLQRFIDARLRSSAAVIALVPSSNILDDDETPERFPCIIIRQDQPTYVFDTIESTLHIWSKVSGFAEVREIAAAIGDTLETSPWPVDGSGPSNLTITGRLFLPRNDGAYSQGVLSVEATLQAREPRAVSIVRASE